MKRRQGLACENTLTATEAEPDAAHLASEVYRDAAEAGRRRPASERLRRPERPHEKLRSLRVLLVQDDDTTRTLLAMVLGKFAANVTSASCAIDAEAALLTFEPQILITDVEMPGNERCLPPALSSRSQEPDVSGGRGERVRG